MTTTPTTQKASAEPEIRAWKDAHPVGRSFHTGLWGFDRIGDCLNLNRCTYKTERGAVLARAKAALWNFHTPDSL